LSFLVKNQELAVLAFQLFGLNFDAQSSEQFREKEDTKIKTSLVYIEDLAKHDYFKDEDENGYQDEADKNSDEDSAVNGEDDAENFSPSDHVFFESSDEDDKEGKRKN